MAVIFTCRLIAVRSTSGKFQVQYGPLGDGNRFFVLRGPNMVLPPDTEMTLQEIDAWIQHLCIERGVTLEIDSVSPTAPLVEATRTYEDIIPKGSVKTEMYWHQKDNGERLFCVRLLNNWDRPIPNVSLAVDYRYDSPQPVASTAEANSDTVCLGQIAGQELFSSLMGGPKAPSVMPGQSLEFGLHPRWLSLLQSRMASLSPENYGIAMRTDENEFDRIGGMEVSDFLDQPSE